jgi:Fe-S-cluster containining protein
MPFPCEKCGACCRAVKCLRLKDNLCSIYETRPDICRVDKVYETFYKDKGITKEQFYQYDKMACRCLRKLEH